MRLIRFTNLLVLMHLAWFGPAHAVEVDLQWLKGTQFLDANGDPLASGTIEIFDAATTSQRTTYTDAAGTIANANPLTLDSAGRLATSVYIPTGAWKLILKDEEGATIVSEDGIEGALDTASLAITSAAPEVSVSTWTSGQTVSAADMGRLITVDPTGGSFTVTLVSAALVGDGKTIAFRHVGSANQVTVATVAGQTIRHFATGGAARTTWPLTQENQSIWLVSDGANWHVLATTWGPAGQHSFQVEDDGLSAPPATPAPGAWYILPASPSGDWAAFAEHDLVQATGSGGWLRLTPAEGWKAYVKDEDKEHLFTGAAWTALPNTDAPAASNRKIAVYRRQLPDGTASGTAALATWTVYELNTEQSDTIGCSLSSFQITCSTGTYRMTARVAMVNTQSFQLRWRNVTDSVIVAYGDAADSVTNGEQSYAIIDATFSVDASTETFELQYYSQNANTNNLGLTNPATGIDEHYATLVIEDLSSLQGPKGDDGDQGPQGAAGLSGLSYTFSSTTTMADPGAGVVRFNGATLASVTAIAIDDTSAESGNPDLSAYLATWDDSGSAVKGILRIVRSGATETIAVYTVSAVSADTGWKQITVAHVASSGSFTDAGAVKVEFIRTGDKGDQGDIGLTGPAGPTVSVSWNFDSSTVDGDPGSGTFRLNNATPASATKAFFDNNERGGVDVSAYIDTWDNEGNSSNRGTLLLIDPADSTFFHLFTVTGSVVDDTGYRDVSITHVAGNGTFTNGNQVAAFLMMAGPATASNSFETVNTPSGTDPVADSATDTLNLTAGTGITITGTAGTDTVDFSLDAEISAFAGLTSAADTLPYYTGSGTATTTTFTATGRSLIDDASISAMQTTLEVVGKQTIWIPGGSLTATATAGATPETREIAADQPMLGLMSYPTASNTNAQFGFPFPKSADESAGITYSVVWTADAGSASQTVNWDMSCLARGNDDPLATGFGTAQGSDDVLIATNDVHISPESSSITVNGSPAEGDAVFCQLERDTADTLSDDAQVIGILVFFTSNAVRDN